MNKYSILHSPALLAVLGGVVVTVVVVLSAVVVIVVVVIDAANIGGRNTMRISVVNAVSIAAEGLTLRTIVPG